MAKLNIVELSSLAIFVLLSLVAVILFLNSLESTEAQIMDRSLRAVNFPAKGELLSISEVDAFWRERRDDDVAQARQRYLPEVQITVTEGSGNLAVIFRDGEGIIQGDPTRVEIDNGKIASTGQSTLSVVCSAGFQSEVDLIWYQSNGGGAVDSPAWTVSILEHSEFNVSLNEWNAILAFDMPGKRSNGNR